MQRREHTENWRTRGYLPHYDNADTLQFVTYRLADSLPTSVIERFRFDLKTGTISETEFHKIVDKFLDSGHGRNYLRNAEVAAIVEENLLHFNGEKYHLHAWVIMPNHVHVLFEPIQEHKLADIMHSMKSYTAHEANKILGRTGTFWSKEYFDRYIRNREHYDRAVRYIENNPVKSRLCPKPENWPFGSARFRC